MKKSFLLHLDSLEILNELTTEQKGLLFEAIYYYHLGKKIELPQLLKVAFIPFKNQFERDSGKYQKIIERNRVNGSKGGRPKKANNPVGLSITQDNPKEPKKPVNVNVNVNDSDNVKDKDTKEKTPVFNFRKELLNLGVENNIADDWMKVRKTKKATNTETAFNLIKNQVNYSGLTANECIKKAVENSWSGFKAEWLKNLGGNGQTRKPTIYDIDPDIKNSPTRMEF